MCDLIRVIDNTAIVGQTVRDIISQNCETNDLCFDIGAYIGETATMLKDCGLRPVCLEPNAKSFQKLVEKLGDMNDFVLLNEAVLNYGGKCDLAICTKRPQLSSTSIAFLTQSIFAHSGEVIWDKVEEVNVTTLNQLIKAYGKPSLVKLDIEGAEAKVLENLKHQIDLIFFEFGFSLKSNFVDSILSLDNKFYYKYNYFLGEFNLSNRLMSNRWMDSQELFRCIEALDVSDGDKWGNIVCLVTEKD